MTTETLPQHVCPASGCGEVQTFPYLFCYRHWTLVPIRLRRESKAALIEALQNTTNGTGYARHQKLAREAIAAVNAKLAKKEAA